MELERRRWDHAHCEWLVWGGGGVDDLGRSLSQLHRRGLLAAADSLDLRYQSVVDAGLDLRRTLPAIEDAYERLAVNVLADEIINRATKPQNASSEHLRAYLGTPPREEHIQRPLPVISIRERTRG